MRSLRCRTAPEVLRANYGNPLEAAGVLLAALRSLEFNAVPAVGVDGVWWNESDTLAPTQPAFSGVAVRVDLPEGPIWADPGHGLFQNPGSWGRQWLLTIGSGGKLESQYVYARGEDKPSEVEMLGKLALGKDGNASGEIRIRVTGALFDPQKLDTADAQTKYVKQLIGRLVGGFEVEGQSVARLDIDGLRVTANVSTKEPLPKLLDKYVLELAEGPVFLADVPLPLDRPDRRTAVRLDGRVHERVDLRVELPEGWQAYVVPAAVSPVRASWGALEQTAAAGDRSVHIKREVSIMRDTVAPADFEGLRRAINELRSNQSRVLIVGEAGKIG
jgi:hypothetical protein